MPPLNPAWIVELASVPQCLRVKPQSPPTQDPSKMTPDPITLLAPACAAFPKYAGLLHALDTLIAADLAGGIVVPPPPPLDGPTTNPAAETLRAGRFVLLDGGGTLSSFDFGDTSGPFNTLRGYSAGHVYDIPGSFVATVNALNQQATQTHVTVVPDTRPVVTLAATDELEAAIAHLTVPTILQLPAGATYDLKTPITLAADGITLRPAGPGPSPRIRRIAAAGVYSTLIIPASDVSIEGIEFDSDQPLKPSDNQKVGIFAINVRGSNLLVRNCTFRNVDDGVHCQPEARGLMVLNCQFTRELRSCAVYLDAMQNAAVLGITALGSVCEHIVRLEGAQNILIHGNDIDNHDGKETIAIRMGHCIAVTGNIIRAWARISQGIARSREHTARKSSSPSITSPAQGPTARGFNLTPAR